MKAQPKAPRWVTVAPDSAPRYLGRTVRLKTSSGKVYEGVLQQPDPAAYQVNTPMGAGSATFNVKPADIAELQVLMR